ncbi:hypothetical protein BDW27_102410 [Nocardiopsis sp. L17-MgMaSL7]|nr:hypothetical protein BDW27_102410 [Nocardiopsis sp. L17-MgMaSL7]
MCGGQLNSFPQCPLGSGPSVAALRGCSSSCSAYGAPKCTRAKRDTHTGTSPDGPRSKSPDRVRAGTEPAFTTRTRGCGKKIQRNPATMATPGIPRESYFTYGPARAGRRAVHLLPRTLPRCQRHTTRSSHTAEGARSANPTPFPPSHTDCPGSRVRSPYPRTSPAPRGTGPAPGGTGPAPVSDHGQGQHRAAPGLVVDLDLGAHGGTHTAVVAGVPTAVVDLQGLLAVQ